jgi:hypothetical protein
MPKHIGTFVDVMGGAFNVGANIVATNKLIYNEINDKVFNIIKWLLLNDKKDIVSKIETAVAGSNDLRAFYFFYSNEGIKDKLASLRQPGATPKWEAPKDVSVDYQKHMLSEMKKDVVNSVTKQVQSRWVKIGGRPNHLWDCECICIASAMLAGVLPIGKES